MNQNINPESIEDLPYLLFDESYLKQIENRVYEPVDATCDGKKKMFELLPGLKPPKGCGPGN